VARQLQEQTRQAEQKQIDEFRRRHPGQIVGLPDLDLLKRPIHPRRECIGAANSYRPNIFSPLYDGRFRTTTFSYPFEFFFPRTNSDDDGPEPEPWETTL